MGGRHTARISVGGLAAIAVAYGMARYGYGLFVPEFRAAFALSTQAVGLVASAAYAAYLTALLAAGVATARVGPRVPVVAGGVAAGVGMALIALAPSPVVFAVGAVVAGSSAGWSWAPFSDAVAGAVPAERRGRALAIVSTGTSIGLLVAAPIALVGGAAWRGVWLAFAACAAAAAVYNAWALPRGLAHQPAGGVPRLRPGWFARPGATPLFGIPFVVTVATSTYFTYAVDLVRATGWPPTAGPTLWALIGAAGLVGLAGGDLARRYGPRRLAAAALTAVSSGIALLGLAPASLLAGGLSAVFYSAGYMLLYATLVAHNGEVFADRPSAGWSATMLVISAASILGPASTGLLASHLGLRPTFLLVAVLPLAAISLARQLPAASPATTTQ